MLTRTKGTGENRKKEGSKMRTTAMVVTGLVVVMVLAGASSAATIYYDLKVNGSDGPVVVDPSDWFLVEIWANVPDSEVAPGFMGGLLQGAFNLVDSTGIVGLMDAQDLIGGGGPFNPPDGYWDSNTHAGMTNYKGQVDGSGADVFDQAAAFAPGDYGTYWNAVGAGDGVWTKIVSGWFHCEGVGTAELTLVPAPLSGQLLYGPGGAESPTAAIGDSVTIIQTPEPATMALMALGFAGIAGLSQRKRK